MNAMNVPLLDLKAQYATIREEVREAIDRVCDAQQFILGPEVEGLEQEIAAFCGAAFAVGMSSGTDALLAALMAVGVNPGDEVLTTPYSFFATAGVAARLGARPVFVDIDPDTFNLDVRAVAPAINQRTRAVIPVHLFGRCDDLGPLLKMAEAHGAAVVEDAAQAIGAVDESGRQAGVIGLVGTLSFFPSKNLGGFGDGGMVLTNDAVLVERLQMLRVHGTKRKYRHAMVGGNFRLDALQAAVLRVKLRYLPRWTEMRRRNAERYRKLFVTSDLASGLAGRVRLPQDSAGHVYNQFVIRCSDRDGLQAFLREHGIGTEVYYPVPLHLQECFRWVGYRDGDFPQAEAAARESLALPIYPELTEDQQEYVVTHLKAFFEGR